MPSGESTEGTLWVVAYAGEVNSSDPIYAVVAEGDSVSPIEESLMWRGADLKWGARVLQAGTEDVSAGEQLSHDSGAELP